MTTEEATPQWSWKTAVERATAQLEAKGLRRLPKPIHEHKDLGEILDIESMSETALANMQARVYAWHAYATVELAFAKAEYYSLEEVYEVYLGEAMFQKGKTSDGKRIVKDVLRSITIFEDEDIRVYHRKRTELQMNYQILEGLVSGLAIQTKALESESIRRASNRRVDARVR